MLIHSSRVPVQRGESLRAAHLTHSIQTQLANMASSRGATKGSLSRVHTNTTPHYTQQGLQKTQLEDSK